MAKKLSHYRFRVTGKGYFPLDMLRYDSCWPSSPGDVDGLSFDPQSDDRHLSRSVNLSSHSDPTDERWNSFRWPVSDVVAYTTDGNRRKVR